MTVVTLDLVLLCFGLTPAAGHPLRQIPEGFEALPASCPLCCVEAEGLKVGEAGGEKREKRRSSCASQCAERAPDCLGFTWIPAPWPRISATCLGLFPFQRAKRLSESSQPLPEQAAGQHWWPPRALAGKLMMGFGSGKSRELCGCKKRAAAELSGQADYSSSCLELRQMWPGDARCHPQHCSAAGHRGRISSAGGAQRNTTLPDFGLGWGEQFP